MKNLTAKTCFPYKFRILIRATTILLLLFGNFRYPFAQIVYVDINPDTTIYANGGYYDIDINFDGIADYRISRGGYEDYNSVDVVSLYDNCYISFYQLDGCSFAKAFSPGQTIGDAEPWFNEFFGLNLGNNGGTNTCMHLGAFPGQTDKYMGLKIIVDGFTYFGWVRIDVAPDATWFRVKDHACSYESIVAFNPQPDPFNFIASNNGAFCNYPNAQGVELIVQPSQTGVVYGLYHEGMYIQTLEGTGSTLSFGLTSMPGNYQVIATTICTGISIISSAVTVISNPLPIAGFTYIVPPCSGTPVLFTNTSTGPGMSNQWSFDDPASGSSNLSIVANPSHIFEAYGNGTQIFNVMLSISDTNGCYDTIVQPVTVIQRPDASLSSNSFIQCGGGMPFDLIVTNTSTTIMTNTLYQIDWGDGTPPFVSNIFTSATHLYTSIGQFDLMLTVTGLNGCTDSKTYSLFNGFMPVVIISSASNLNGCAEGGFCVSMEVSGTAMNIGTQYVVDWGDGTINTFFDVIPSILEHCYLETSCSMPDAAFTITVTATNLCGSLIASISPVRVSSSPVSSFISPDEACSGTPVTFENTSQSGCDVTGGFANHQTSYRWYVDGILTQENLAAVEPPDFIYDFPSIGDHTVSLVSRNACNMNQPDSIFETISIGFDQTVFIWPLSQITCSGEATETIYISNSSPLLLPFEWTASASPGLTGYLTSGVGWYIPSFIVINTSSTNGTVTFYITSLYDCSDTIYQAIITVAPTPSIGGNSNFNKTICSGSSTDIILTSSVPGTIYSYTAAATPNVTGYLSSGYSSGSLNHILLLNTTTPGTVTYYIIPISPAGCIGQGIEYMVTVLPNKALNLTIFLESLYDLDGVMRKAHNENGEQYPGSVADKISIELHSATDYSLIIQTISNVDLSISGSAIVEIPCDKEEAYYITVRHRNSIETVSSMPVSFSGSNVDYAFNLPSQVYGNNLLASGDGRWLIFGGDVNQDGLIESGDMIPIDNLSEAFTEGYIPEDANGDGLIDSSDMMIVDNNVMRFVSRIIPY